MPISDTNKLVEDNGDGKGSKHMDGAIIGDTQSKGDDASAKGEDQIQQESSPTQQVGTQLNQ